MRKLHERSEVGATSDRFEQLFRTHHSAVVAYVRRRARPDAVDDVVAETFLVAWRRLDRVPANGLPWLLAVARNVLATQRRGALRRDALVRRVLRMGVRPEGAGIEAGTDGRVAAALAKLRPKDREAVMLTAWDGLSPHEAALVLGEKPGTFRVRLHRARGRLRRLLEEKSGLAQTASDHGPLVVEEIVHD